MERSWIRIFLFCIPYLISVVAPADEIYLTVSQKALISLGLKTLLIAEENQPKLNQALKELSQGIRLIQAGKPIEVKSFGEFLNYQKNEAVFAEKKLQHLQTAELNYLLIEPVFVSHTPSVQKKINQYYWNKSQIEKSHLARGLPVDLESFLKTEQITRGTLEKIASEKIDHYTNEFTAQFIKGPGSSELLVLTKLLKSYYKSLPTGHKAEILYRLMQLPYQASSVDVFLVLLQNSGPQMQKLVQIMGRSPHVPKSLQVVFQKLESQVKPVPWWEVRQIIEAETDLSRFTYFERKALGVGTMAQTHRAQMIDQYGQKRNYVVRFLKPEIDKLLEMDHIVLKKITSEIDADPEIKALKLPSLEKLVEDIHASVVEELELEKTVEQQKIGETVYRHKSLISFSGQKNELIISVPTVELMGRNKKLMLQELVFGKKPSSETHNYAEIYPDLYRTISERVAEHWLEQAFFKSGFFHADLHQGNMLLQVQDQAIQANLLDFGMTGQLSALQRKSVLLLTLGIKTNNSDLVTDSFANLSRIPLKADHKHVLRTKIKNRMDLIIAQVEKDSSLEDWTSWVMQHGIELQYDFIKLNRGIMAIKGLLADSRSPLQLEDLGDKIVLRNKASLLSMLKNEPQIKYSDLIRVGFQTVMGKKSPSTVQCESLF